MHFAEILGLKSKQKNKNFNEVSLIFWLPWKPSTERNDSLKALQIIRNSILAQSFCSKLGISLKAFNDFKNKQQKCMKYYFLIWKSTYILRVYSV